MYYVKVENSAGQYINSDGNRFDIIASEVVDFAPGFVDYSTRELLVEALEELGLSLYRNSPKRYSRLKIINKLDSNWVAIENGMNALERAKFYGATFLERGNTDFEAFIEKLKPSMPNIEELLIGCEYE